jgi:hypothetical protein
MLRWEEDVDLEHGTVHIHRARDRDTGRAKSTKTKHARRINVEPNLLPLLRATHKESKGNGFVIAMPSERVLARGLRRWLHRAGVSRAELFVSDATRKALTFHDLRATGLTWMAIRGDDPLRIQQRAGHEDFKTTQGYIREAEAVREGFGEVFPVLPSSLLGDRESSEESSEVLQRRGSAGLEGRVLVDENVDTATIPDDLSLFGEKRRVRVPSTPLESAFFVLDRRRSFGRIRNYPKPEQSLGKGGEDLPEPLADGLRLEDVDLGRAECRVAAPPLDLERVVAENGHPGCARGSQIVPG